MLPAATRPVAAAALTTHRLAARRAVCSARRCAVVAMARPWRPDMNDVDRLSRGDAAKIRGTGNFNIPHRLNADERPVFEAAKKKGFLQVRGSGYRKGRKGNPLPNIWRQWCDAKGWACIVIEQDASGASEDVVVVDLAPLRLTALHQVVQVCRSIAQAAGAAAIPPSQRPLDAVPFNTLPVGLPQPVLQMMYPEQAAAAASSSSSSSLPPAAPEEISAAEVAVVQQGATIRQLKASGHSNSSPEVQQEVQELLRLKQHLQQLLDRAAAQEQAAAEAPAQPSSSSSESSESSSSSSSNTGNDSGGSWRLEEDHPLATAAIWQIPAMPLFFSATRPVAKDLAKQLIAALAHQSSSALLVPV